MVLQVTTPTHRLKVYGLGVYEFELRPTLKVEHVGYRAVVFRVGGLPASGLLDARHLSQKVFTSQSG